MHASVHRCVGSTARTQHSLSQAEHASAHYNNERSKEQRGLCVIQPRPLFVPQRVPLPARVAIGIIPFRIGIDSARARSSDQMQGRAGQGKAASQGGQSMGCY